MRAKRKTVVSVVLALVALWLVITWLEGHITLPPGHYQLCFACNGQTDEQRFLVEQVDTKLDEGKRRLTSPDAFVTYKIAIDDCEPNRAFWKIKQVEFHLEFSPDGKDWSTLVRIEKFSEREAEKFSRQSCGFSSRLKKAASESGYAYVRFSTVGGQGDSYPAIKYFGLQVSGPKAPEHFHGFSLWWKLMGFLPARLMVIVGLGSVIICKKFWKTRWRLFGLGALLWIASVTGKSIFALLANKPIETALQSVLPRLPANLVFWSYIGLLTGIFECGIFLLLARYLRRKQWTWNQASSVGVGFGAVEAVMLGAAAAIAASLEGPVSSSFDFASWLLGPVERLIALALHTASVTMIFYAFTQRKWGWFVSSFFYKSGVDAVAAFVLLSGTNLLQTHPWFVQLCLFGPFAYAGLYILVLLRRRWSKIDYSGLSSQIEQ